MLTFDVEAKQRGTVRDLGRCTLPVKFMNSSKSLKYQSLGTRFFKFSVFYDMCPTILTGSTRFYETFKQRERCIFRIDTERKSNGYLIISVSYKSRESVIFYA